MKVSALDLAYEYTKKYIPEPTNAQKRDVLDEIEYLLDKGWTAEEITKHCDGSKGSPIEELKGKQREKENLLKAGTFYYHNELRIFPGAPKRIIDYNTGVITKVDEPHFLEMRASYSYDDLIDYYFKQHGEIHPNKHKRAAGAFAYLLKNYSLETVLFMIDQAANFIKEEDAEPLDSPLGIEAYHRAAIEVIGEKMTEERLAGDDKVVPRRRVPLGRGRSQT